MHSTVYSIFINEHKEEKIERGTAYFPCSAYTGNIHQFVTKFLPPHWHREMEMFILDEGMVRITTVNGDFKLQGCFALLICQSLKLLFAVGLKAPAISQNSSKPLLERIPDNIVLSKKYKKGAFAP